MDERQRNAAAGLAEGKTIEMVAEEVGRSTRTINKWLCEIEFQAAVLRGIRGVALYMLAQNLKYGGNPKVSQTALATLRYLGVGKTARKESGKDPVEEEETDLGDFSEKTIRRLEGDE